MPSEIPDAQTTLAALAQLWQELQETHSALEGALANPNARLTGLLQMALAQSEDALRDYLGMVQRLQRRKDAKE